jgi:site-specific recombinase XerD
MAKTIGAHGGSLQDVKALMGHSFLSTTARYIEKDEEAQRKAVRAQ